MDSREVDATTFGEWLRHRRKDLGLTQAELARKVGCATITIQKIEADERRPSRDMAQWLAEACEVSSPQRRRFLRLARAGRTLTVREQVALDRRPTNLPLSLPPLIGRERDLTVARRRILHDGARLLSITGPPGVGKTLLSLHLASEALSAFEDGAFFVALASAGDAQSVAGEIAKTLDINEAGPAAGRRVKEYLSGKQLLLVLDNFEHLLGSAPMVGELLGACPWLTVIATSRAPLRIRAERRLLLEPLALPPEETAHSADLIAQSPAVALFVERAQAVRADFVMSTDDADTIAQVCTRLGGLPLAIELVAARASVLTPDALLERLDGGVLLDSGSIHDLPDRHRTMRAAIAWSYELLAPDEQKLFARLAVCQGQFGLDLAEALAGSAVDCAAGDPDHRVALDCLASLVDKSLVVRRDRATEPRFQLLEPIREYALEVLKKAGEDSGARRCHANFCLSLACEAANRLRERGQTAWLDRLECERGHLDAALGFFLGTGDDPEGALRMVNALFWFWNIRGYLSEGRAWLTRALERAQHAEAPLRYLVEAMSALAALEWQEGDLQPARAHVDESLRSYFGRQGGPSRDYAMALCVQAMIAVFQGDDAAAAAAAEASVRMFGELGDRWGTALALNPIGKVRLQRHENAAARAAFDRSLALFRDLGDNWGAGIPLMNLGVLEAADGDRDAARTRLEQSIQCFEVVGERWMRALVLDGLATLLVADGEVARAMSVRRESVDILTKMGLTANLATVLLNFARVLQSDQNHEPALALFEQSLELLSGQRLPEERVRCLIGLASASTACGDMRRAARVLGAAGYLIESGGLQLARDDQMEHDRTMIGVRAALGEDTANAEGQQGRASERACQRTEWLEGRIVTGRMQASSPGAEISRPHATVHSAVLKVL